MSRIAKKMPQVMILLKMSNKINRDRIQGILRYERLYGPWRLHIVEGKRFEQPSRDLRSLGVDGVIAGTTLTELLEPIMHARLITMRQFRKTNRTAYRGLVEGSLRRKTGQPEEGC